MTPMTPTDDALKKLGIGEQDAANDITALVLSALNDENPAHTVQYVARILDFEDSGLLLDALSLIPILLPSSHPQADLLIDVIAKYASAKEICIAVQETLSPLSNEFLPEDDDGETVIADASTQLIRALGLYASSIPRLSLRKKSPHDTLLPLFRQLQDVVRCTQPELEQPRSVVILGRTCHVIAESVRWVGDVVKAGAEEVETVKSLCLTMLDSVLEATYDTLNTTRAQTTLDELFPRLVVPRGRPGAGAQAGGGSNEVLEDVMATYTLLGRTPTSVIASPSSYSSIPTLALLGHTKYSSLPSSTIESTLTTPDSPLLPTIVEALGSTSGLDAALTIITRACIIPIPTTSAQSSSSASQSKPLPTSLLPLLPALAFLSAAHPFHPIRAVAFKILGNMISRCEERVRVKVLVELCGKESIEGGDSGEDDADWGLESEGEEEGEEGRRDVEVPRIPQAPQMHVAAVGLVKDEVLRALSSPASPREAARKSPFASPTFLRTFGPLLFVPRPRGLFDALYAEGQKADGEMLSSFLGGPEAARLVQVLSFLFVLMMRDRSNVTGIRSPRVMGTIRKVLLEPLRRVLADADPRSTVDGHDHTEHEHGDAGGEGMVRAALEMGLERVDGVLAASGS